jgi:hypothetical protein
MKICLTFLMSLCLVFESHARLKQSWSYDTLNDKATLVVIATPTKVTATSELSALPNIVSVQNAGTNENVMGEGVETSFEVLTVLKGERSTKTLVLHHFMLAKPGVSFNGPGLASFEPKDNKRFLMFLQREADGRYVAVSGQTDPQDAIKEIMERFP